MQKKSGISPKIPKEKIKGWELPPVKLIKQGNCTLEAIENPSLLTTNIKYSLGIGGGSNVILIETDRRVLVDTGFEYESRQEPGDFERNGRQLIRALADCGYTPDDIDAVFITHWHLDHFGNLKVFPKAEHLASRALVEEVGLKDFTGVEDGEKVAEKVKVMFTPGHTREHASLLLNSAIRVAVAGDAIVSLSYFDKGKLWNYNQDFYSIEEGLSSMKRLAESSDLIIPGHGLPFLTYLPEWIR
jgi:glyoxylase-like metal-dependent hydrolase (beta-lactamase superfamily II)